MTTDTFLRIINNIVKTSAGVAHLVERHLAKVEVASSSLVVRSSRITLHPVRVLGIAECVSLAISLVLYARLYRTEIKNLETAVPR